MSFHLVGGRSLGAHLMGVPFVLRHASRSEDRRRRGAPVGAGLLGATFSSALASAVGAPRILQALGNHDLLPASGWMSQRTDAGEPRNAMMITGGIVLVSFRPILRLPRMVSFAGAAGCLLAMFVVNPTFGLAALAIAVVFYGLLVRRPLDHSMADVHCGPVHCGPVYRGPVYRGPVYRGPVHRDPSTKDEP